MKAAKSSKVLASTANVRKPPNAGKGRVKGVPNKVTGDIKAMILTALSNKGGAKYLERQADENPVAFMGLIGKVLPMQVTGADGGAVIIRVSTGVDGGLDGGRTD